jgi:hypothetical protein
MRARLKWEVWDFRMNDRAHDEMTRAQMTKEIQMTKDKTRWEFRSIPVAVDSRWGNASDARIDA